MHRQSMQKCCDSTRVQNYKWGACCESSKTQVEKVRDDLQNLNQTNRRQSRADRGESYSFDEDNKVLEYDEYPIPQVDWKPLDGEYPSCLAPTSQSHDAENYDEEEEVKHQIIMQCHVEVIDPGPLISGRLNLHLIERARMLHSQFYGTANEETAVNVNDLYSCLYDRDVNKTEERRSTLINFRQVMLDVEYTRHVIGPSNEIKI